jgi:hypothetical protein
VYRKKSPYVRTARETCSSTSATVYSITLSLSCSRRGSNPQLPI